MNDSPLSLHMNNFTFYIFEYASYYRRFIRFLSTWTLFVAIVEITKKRS